MRKGGDVTLPEAINRVCDHLHHRKIVFTLFRAWEVSSTEFHVAVHAVQPFDDMLHFRVVNRWEVEELDTNKVDIDLPMMAEDEDW